MKLLQRTVVAAKGNRILRSRAVTAIVSASLAAGVVGGVAVATNDSNTIHACVGKGGVPRIVKASADCRRGESYIDWNKQGTQGAAGLPGATGPQGPQGPEGPQGPVGPEGAQGATGLPGAVGEQGETGAEGPQGPVGPQGVPGPQGTTGATGATGPQGPAGTNAAPTRWAFVALGGTIVSSSGLQSASSTPTSSVYTLVWNRDVGRCATVASTMSNQYASVSNSGNTTTVTLWHDSGVSGGGTSIHVAVFCPS